MVLRPGLRGWPRESGRVLFGYTAADVARTAGLTGLLTETPGGRPIAAAFSEVAYRPYVFLVLESGELPHRNLTDITDWADAGPSSFRQVHILAPVLDIFFPFPGNYESDPGGT